MPDKSFLEADHRIDLRDRIFREVIGNIIVHREYTDVTMADHVNNWHTWLNLDPKWLPKLTESLKNIEIDSHLQKMTWNQQIEYLIPTWIENANKITLSSTKKPPKSEKNNIIEYQVFDNTATSSFNEFPPKSELNLNEKANKLPNKKLNYVITILLMIANPISIEELMLIFEYKDKKYFRQNYVKHLEMFSLIKKTNPEKPTASNQKYIITEKGKQFLTA